MLSYGKGSGKNLSMGLSEGYLILGICGRDWFSVPSSVTFVGSGIRSFESSARRSFRPSLLFRDSMVLEMIC